MRILNATGEGFYPQATGGVQVCLAELMQAQHAMGHSPTLLAALWGGKLATRSKLAMRLTRTPWVRHRWNSFDVYRKWRPWEHADAIAKLSRPDAVLVHGTKHTYHIAKAFLQLGFPVCFYIHDIFFHLLGGDIKELSGVRFISNSEFTRDRMKETYGIDSDVVPPVFFDSKTYYTETSRKNVTFINPLPLKGSEVAFGLAELCPEIPFNFVESWILSRDQEKDIKQRIAALPNVRLSRHVNDMRLIYRDARVILAPSQVDEAWGRIVSEAQCSGIPALYALSGGLPEAAHKGGIGLDRKAPAEEWAAALRKLWTDETFYQEKSEAALRNANRMSQEKDQRLMKLAGLNGRDRLEPEIIDPRNAA